MHWVLLSTRQTPVHITLSCYLALVPSDTPWKSITCEGQMQGTAGPLPLNMAVTQIATCLKYSSGPFTPLLHGLVQQLFTFSSGYSCALASPVKPKRWPGILSFDPRWHESALVAGRHSYDSLLFNQIFKVYISQSWVWNIRFKLSAILLLHIPDCVQLSFTFFKVDLPPQNLT